MKYFSVVLLTLFSSIAVSADVNTVTCTSRANAHAYFRSTAQWKLKLNYMLKDGIIQKVSFTANSNQDLGFTSSTIRASKVKTKNPKIAENYNVYVQSDAWCTYQILLPKGLNEIEDNFGGVIKSVCDEGDGGQFNITCRK